MKRIIAIIQARMGSTRLPGKVMMDIGDRPVLAHLIGRLKQVPLVHDIVVATTSQPRDSVIEQLCRELDIKVYRGSEVDVLSRYVEAARLFKADVIFRATSDEPYKDPQVIEQVLKAHLENKADYTCNNLVKTFPDGSTVEIVNGSILEKVNRLGKKPADREHVTFYIYNHPKEFWIQNIEAREKLRRPDLRYCLDTQEDLEVVRAIFDHLGSRKPYFTMEQIISFLDEQKKLNPNFGLKK